MTFSTRRLSSALAIPDPGLSGMRHPCEANSQSATPRICSSACMLVLILTMLTLLSSVVAVSLLDRNALR